MPIGLSTPTSSGGKHARKVCFEEIYENKQNAMKNGMLCLALQKALHCSDGEEARLLTIRAQQSRGYIHSVW